jgi:hypothetical protein
VGILGGGSRVVPEQPLADPRKRPGWTLQPPAPNHPLAVGVLSHLTVVVREPAAALSFLIDVCGGRVFAEDADEQLGSRGTWVTVGEEATVFEIAVPIKDGPRKRDLEKVGNTVHSVTFTIRDLNRGKKYLASKGLAFEMGDDRLAVTDPRSSLGLRFGFSESFHPGDPRASSGMSGHTAPPGTSDRQRAKGPDQ